MVEYHCQVCKHSSKTECYYETCKCVKCAGCYNWHVVTGYCKQCATFHSPEPATLRS